MDQKQNTKFFSTGSTLLDLALGGGWACARIFNLVGDRSSGKTLLAIEAFANFVRAFKNAEMRYAETEARFDSAFAATLGFPSSVARPKEPLNTIEDFQNDLNTFVTKLEHPGLYILDSLDALSDEAELKKFKDQDEGGSYGVAKAKKMSQLFRMLAREIEGKNCCVGIISQLRDNIGVTFGETSTRSGGRALNFYASQILWLREDGKNSRTSQGEERVTSVDVFGKVKKCSVGMPFREANFSIVFGYGVDDELSMLNWLGPHMEEESIKQIKSQLTSARNKQDYAALEQISISLKADVTRIWNEIEEKLRPKIQKYRPEPTPKEIIAEAKKVVKEVSKEVLVPREVKV